MKKSEETDEWVAWLRKFSAEKPTIMIPPSWGQRGLPAAADRTKATTYGYGGGRFAFKGVVDGEYYVVFTLDEVFGSGVASPVSVRNGYASPASVRLSGRTNRTYAAD